MKSKFICGATGSGHIVAIVFPEWMIHRDMAIMNEIEVISAGFVSLGIHHHRVVVEPYGRSVSIGVGIKEEHRKLTKHCLETALGIRE